MIMRNTLSTATIACVVKWIRKRLGVQILMSINNKKRVKVKVRLQGGRLVKREVRGLRTTKDRMGMSEQEGRGRW